jgi:hypothetical protein
MSRNVPAGNYVVHFDRDRAHHRAWLQAVLERLEKLDSAALSRDGDLHAIWTAAVPNKPPERPANSYQALAPLLALIRSGEGHYNSVNRGRAGDTPGGWVGLTSMSLAEVLQAQQLQKVFAVGAYQFIPETLKTAVQVAGLDVTMPFSPEVQDHLATVLILGGKRPHLRDYLIGKAASIEAAQLDLAKEWAAIPTAEGRGFYDGDSAGNKATIAVNQVQAALIQSRLNLQDTDLAAITPPPSSSRLTVTQAEPQFYPQTDNGAQADRTCFTSAAAMLAKAVKPSSLTGSNADWEQYYPLVRKHGDTINAAAQVAALAELGIKARLVKNADWGLIHEQVKRWGGLALGYIHRGPVNRPDPASNGHWCYCWGIDDTHLLIHDPQGEPDMVNGGFVPGRSGRSVKVSRQNFGRRWMVTPSASGWMHTPGTGWALVVDGVT